MEPATQKVTKRSFAMDVIRRNLPLLDTEGHKACRSKCLEDIQKKFPDTSNGSLQAVYNDAKHILINNGEIKPFGRHAQGRNKTSVKIPVVNTAMHRNKNAA